VISFHADLKIMLAAQPVDFRKSVHTLSALVSEALRAKALLQIPVHRGQSFRRIADSIPVIADSFL
jgi:transposase